MITAKELIEELNEEKSMKVEAIKQDPNKQVQVGDKGEMVMNKDGSVTVKFPQHDLEMDFKTEKGALKFVKKV